MCALGCHMASLRRLILLAGMSASRRLRFMTVFTTTFSTSRDLQHPPEQRTRSDRFVGRRQTAMRCSSERSFPIEGHSQWGERFGILKDAV
jgi:hypothetical protein